MKSKMTLRSFLNLSACCAFALALLPATHAVAQNLTLEGQTGGFITPTAYVVPAEKGAFFSHPAVGYHFVNSNAVIGDIHTFSITEGFANRAEVGYTRNVHITGDDPNFSFLWNYSGMNIFHGKAVVLKESTGAEWVPGLAAGFVVRTGDHFVSGALYQMATGTQKSYTNGDVYGVLTKSYFKPPVPFLLNFGLKFTNASIYGIGGQATRFGGRLFGGLGIPIPIGGGWVAVPAAGFTQQQPNIVNLSALLAPTGGTHIPTTLDYAVRITKKENAHFTFDIGVGQVAGTIGSIAEPTGLPAPAPAVVLVPVDLKARSVLGLGLSYKY
jgi:hypothetical protein